MPHENIKMGRLPVLSWCRFIESGALAQIENLSNHPMLFHHIAVMPDCHQGYGMPIGGVIAVDGALIPNAVGVDIGCGMCAVKTNLREWSADSIKRVLASVRSQVPLGFSRHKQIQNLDNMPAAEIDPSMMPVAEKEFTSARYQVGTLGGGNHFIELQKDAEGFLWIMIHSGSRNIGKQVADYYINIADSQRRGEVPLKWQLSYLDQDSREGMMYFHEMGYCIEFAFANRRLMMERIMSSVSDTFGHVRFGGSINIAHNYASLETHFGRHVWVHRKGATFAGNSTIGIIPGSQGTPSYIIKGKANPLSFLSCSHGAGRKMGRKEAERRLDLAAEKMFLDQKGIIHSLHSKSGLEEASGAYKNIDEVMEAQNDLAEIVTRLEPVAVIKG
jgi:tRNA-splicing ligase RtcB (3'-phosphate/5'-hydroxy nucleic acid ligase)